MLRREIGTQRALAYLAARLDRIEGAAPPRNGPPPRRRFPACGLRESLIA